MVPAQPRHIPERSCVACRKKRPQGELVRVTKGVSGWQLLGGARTGRGAYVCVDSPACWQDKKLRRTFGQAAPGIAAQLAEHYAKAHRAQSISVDQPMMT